MYVIELHWLSDDNLQKQVCKHLANAFHIAKLSVVEPLE